MKPRTTAYDLGNGHELQATRNTSVGRGAAKRLPGSKEPGSAIKPRTTAYIHGNPRKRALPTLRRDGQTQLDLELATDAAVLELSAVRLRNVAA